MEDKIKETISTMKKSYDGYCIMARQNLAEDLIEDYWYWRGIAEGTKRSWELLEKVFGLTDINK